MNRSLEESRGTDFFGILNVGGDYRYRADFLSESDNFLEGSRRLPENRGPPRTPSFQPMSRRLPDGNGVVGHDERDDPDRALCGGVHVIATRGHEVELSDGGIA